ncbi:MAG: hypothetical protein UV80_C0002G0205 [Candidatus Peregrinibacteria bacterium GW2011_GWF2_43_17]|nr:MAG: hypothetical protein UV80_C0002G0205 [Candidatus Peregrinibacteria bacterium GW2011_GWF2_43_17]KKT18774.1 MAG: hypothetical protein UW03_C0031G0006 [Candidatus Peregrinibacteria bacterium GW2011_GWA2_43_8]HAU39751.1 hypothetical protein [Candidatus Peregrinibacteria bacterium]
MELHYKNPVALIEKVIKDLSLNLSREEETKLRDDLSDILAARLYKLFMRLFNGNVEPFTDNTRFFEYVMATPAFERELEFETALFYDDMMQNLKIAKAYRNYKTGIEKKA